MKSCLRYSVDIVLIHGMCYLDDILVSDVHVKFVSIRGWSRKIVITSVVEIDQTFLDINLPRLLAIIIQLQRFPDRLQTVINWIICFQITLTVVDVTVRLGIGSAQSIQRALDLIGHGSNHHVSQTDVFLVIGVMRNATGQTYDEDVVHFLECSEKASSRISSGCHGLAGATD
ncbi:AAEL012244-PA [Aedes aegypti]|uniref:AAEL012244-PA n=1 Tax=Aedes aegypti TaxID=7159 RepID=Q16MN5_AEDAE|nr:AAEL012244-PA [Aedes aegypti]